MRHAVPVRRRSGSWLIAGMLFAGMAAAPARACVLDAECDDGVACSLPDRCDAGLCVAGGGGDVDGDGWCGADDNCPTLANADQVDRDGDGQGDVCDAHDADLNVVRLTVKQNSIPPDDNSRIKSKGFIFTQPPSDVFDPSGGVTLRVTATAGLDQVFAWSALECVTKQPGKTNCQSADHAWRIGFKTFRKSTQVVQYLATVRQIGLGTVPQAPVTLTLTQTGSVDRVGPIGDCAIHPTTLVCSEF